jgi:hypothetical protein
MASISIKIHQKSVQNPSKSTPGARPRKNNKNNEKSDVWDCSSVSGFGAKCDPKWHQQIVKKSMPKKYAKMTPKGSPRGRKWSQNGSQNLEKKTMQKAMPKTDRKNYEKTLKMKAPNLEKLCFSFGKTSFLQNTQFL